MGKITHYRRVRLGGTPSNYDPKDLIHWPACFTENPYQRRKYTRAESVPLPAKHL